MAIKNYQYRALLDIIQGGYPGETTGTDPVDESWHDSTSETGDLTYTYYYRDSTASSNTNSSKVEVKIQDTWTASVDNRNYLTITVSTKILSIVRTDIQGNPSAGGAGVFNIYVRREAGGTVLAQFLNDNINTAHTISGEIDLGSYTFTLVPGEEAQRGTVYYCNDIVGSELDDAFWMGISFKNTLPRDYRPGKTWNGSAWMSHNRSTGAANIRGTNWTEMRTESGDGTTTGNPPYIRNANSMWANQRLIGNE